MPIILQEELQSTIFFIVFLAIITACSMMRKINISSHLHAAAMFVLESTEVSQGDI